jgi:hypothetical protein
VLRDDHAGHRFEHLARAQERPLQDSLSGDGALARRIPDPDVVVVLAGDDDGFEFFFVCECVRGCDGRRGNERDDSGCYSGNDDSASLAACDLVNDIILTWAGREKLAIVIESPA